MEEVQISLETHTVIPRGPGPLYTASFYSLCLPSQAAHTQGGFSQHLHRPRTPKFADHGMLCISAKTLLAEQTSDPSPVAYSLNLNHLHDTSDYGRKSPFETTARRGTYVYLPNDTYVGI
jgi:hypothetical protein